MASTSLFLLPQRSFVICRGAFFMFHLAGPKSGPNRLEPVTQRRRRGKEKWYLTGAAGAGHPRTGREVCLRRLLLLAMVLFCWPGVGLAQRAADPLLGLDDFMLWPSRQLLPGGEAIVVDQAGGRVQAVQRLGGDAELRFFGRCLPAFFRPGPGTGCLPGVKCRAAPPRSSRLEHLVVMIDPGHGGEHSGAVGWGGIVEKQVVLAIARQIAGQLAQVPDVEVILTRRGDETVSLERRVEMANEVGADVFISVHANAFVRSTLGGVETFFHSLEATGEEARRVARYENAPGGKAVEPGPDTVAYILQDIKRAETLRDSSRLAHLVQERLAAALPWENRGVMQADFIVLRGTSMPSVLLELGFLTNPDDARLLKRTDSHRAVARAVRDSVVQFWGLLRRKLARNASGGGKP